MQDCPHNSLSGTNRKGCESTQLFLELVIMLEGEFRDGFKRGVVLCVGPAVHPQMAWGWEVQQLKGLVARCGVQVHNKVSAVVWMVDLVYVRRKANDCGGVVLVMAMPTML